MPQLSTNPKEQNHLQRNTIIVIIMIHIYNVHVK